MAKVILDIPKIKQMDKHCVPASLAMVCKYYGFNNNQKEIAKWFDYDIQAKGGIDNKDLVPCIRAHGFIAHPSEKVGLEGIMRSIDKGIPLLAIVKTNIFGKEELGVHAVVVRGYETNPDIVWFNDPLVLERNKMLYEDFNKEWKNIRKNCGCFNQYGVTIREPSC